MADDETEARLDAAQEWLDHHPMNFEHLCMRCELNGWEPCEKHKPDPGRGLLQPLWQIMPSAPIPPIRERTPQELAEAYGSPVAAYEQWIGRCPHRYDDA